LPSLEPKLNKQPPQPEAEKLTRPALPEADLADLDREQALWEEYRRQQQRRSCPGCGDDGVVL
jgi:hypothetical protein